LVICTMTRFSIDTGSNPAMRQKNGRKYVAIAAFFSGLWAVTGILSFGPNAVLAVETAKSTKAALGFDHPDLRVLLTLPIKSTPRSTPSAIAWSPTGSRIAANTLFRTVVTM
jgi:hypothetical protein